MDKKINIGRLIEKIGPLNNQIRQSNGYRKLSFMWDVGDILLRGSVKKIHPVAWEIQHKSYITRDLLSYCYRIKRKWPNKSDLYNSFRNLKSYSIFREALPLIENEKFILDDKKIKEIIQWLNQDDSRIAKDKLLDLKRKYINIKTDRSGRLWEVRQEADLFKRFHKYLIDLISQEKKQELEEILKIGSNGLLQLAQMCMSISSDNYKGPQKIEIQTYNEKLEQFIKTMLPLSLAKKEVKARFRRLVSPNFIIEIADIFNSLKNKEPLLQIRKRLKLKINTEK